MVALVHLVSAIGNLSAPKRQRANSQATTATSIENPLYFPVEYSQPLFSLKIQKDRAIICGHEKYRCFGNQVHVVTNTSTN